MIATKNKRSHALDALRGYAIMTMVLSAMEAFKVLPRWMYHAQVPPPDHVFNPHIYGITWVDLIFPFFLFSMGAAIPLAFRKQLGKATGEPGAPSLTAVKWQLTKKSVLRWAKLTFFAIYCIHMYPFMMGYSSEVLHYVVPILAFLLMFVLFMRNPFHLPRLWDRVVNTLAYVVAGVWLVVQPYADGQSFSFQTCDIIMIILAQVAVSGSIIYLLTLRRPVARLLVIMVIMGLFMSGHVMGSWQQLFLDSSPVAWLWNWRYQEYLIIILVGTMAINPTSPTSPNGSSYLSQGPSPSGKGEGTTLTEESAAKEDGKATSVLVAGGTALLSFAIIICNVVCLYNRWMVANVLLSAVMAGALIIILRNGVGEKVQWKHLATMGAWLLAIGLCVEAYEGGIRKDDVTLSYLFVTSALAVYALLFFTIVCDHWHVRWISWPLEMTGRNPMVAYVAGSMVVIPVLSLLHVYPFFEAMDASPALGFVKGLILTAFTMAIAIFCTHKKWYWKT